jgi:hypothetical protein
MMVAMSILKRNEECPVTYRISRHSPRAGRTSRATFVHSNCFNSIQVFWFLERDGNYLSIKYNMMIVAIDSEAKLKSVQVP